MGASTLREMTQLHLSRPAPDAPAPMVAAWYERKALLMEHLAAEHAQAAARLPEQAQENATQLMTRNPTPTGPGSAGRPAKTESAEPGLSHPSTSTWREETR